MSIEKALGGEGFVGLPYGETEAQFQIQDDQLFLEPFPLETDMIEAEVSGAVRKDGSIDLSLTVHRPLAATYQITGSLNEPHISHQSSVIGHQSGSYISQQSSVISGR